MPKLWTEIRRNQGYSVRCLIWCTSETNYWNPRYFNNFDLFQSWRLESAFHSHQKCAEKGFGIFLFMFFIWHLISAFVFIFQFHQFRASLTNVSGATVDAVKPIVNAIDSMEISERIETYRSFGQFLTDVEWVMNKYDGLFHGKHDRSIYWTYW